MKLLVIGGTSFVGRAFVEEALEGDHEITLLHRGKTGADLFPELEHVLGDRATDLGKLGDRHWDAVYDSSGFLPRVVRASTEFFRDRATQYQFISTISVYEDWATPDRDENGRLGQIDHEDTDVLDNSTYGPYKVRCEKAVEAAFDGRCTIVRPGLIFGPHDPTNRFPYWVDRFATQQEVLVPSRLEQPTQQIDARDLAAFSLRCIENRIFGIYNACGGEHPKTLGDLFAICQSLNPASKMVPAPTDFLEAHEVDLPLVMPPDETFDGHMKVDNRRAIAAGLRFRDWAETTRDTWAWLQTETRSAEPRFGKLDKQKEQELIELLKASA